MSKSVHCRSGCGQCWQPVAIVFAESSHSAAFTASETSNRKPIQNSHEGERAFDSNREQALQARQLFSRHAPDGIERVAKFGTAVVAPMNRARLPSTVAKTPAPGLWVVFSTV